ncbi:MAG: phospholipid/cholesterol/gamma-HCH transport system substrate-binding protein [Gammaproteobacteria bacterium]|jgi:phospholipid/cholesterol/gamma-HCH transport system substrate-binding protein|nr:phospholipid/cholesterol/gamma-HCH transport system substrate-binding protein [Gammaproteobacteria bacterium]
MEREANYAAVGAFVLLVTLIGALFIYWYSDSRDHKIFRRYEIYFDGSVSGLERGAAVRYLGVGVGRVQKLHIDPRDPGRVQVIVDIDSSTPISDKTLAELQLQGVTGLLFIDLQQIRANLPLPPIVPGIDYPVIRSARSRFDVFLARLPDVLASAGEVVDRAARALSDQNIVAISHALTNIDKASEGLPQTLREVNRLVGELHGATADLAASAKGARQIVDQAGPEVVASLKRVHVVADNLATATDQIDKLIGDNRQDLRSFTRDGLPELERLLREGRAAAQELRELSSSLRENPSQLLYQPRQVGLEIPK